MKKIVIVFLAVFFLFAALISGSMAGHYHHGCGDMSNMSDMDSNQDGQITFDEFSAPHMEKYKSAFKMLDTNNDEVISKEEWDEFLKVHGYGDAYKSQLQLAFQSSEDEVGNGNLNLDHWKVEMVDRYPS